MCKGKQVSLVFNTLHFKDIELFWTFLFINVHSETEKFHCLNFSRSLIQKKKILNSFIF